MLHNHRKWRLKKTVDTTIFNTVELVPILIGFFLRYGGTHKERFDESGKGRGKVSYRPYLLFKQFSHIQYLIKFGRFSLDVQMSPAISCFFTMANIIVKDEYWNIFLQLLTTESIFSLHISVKCLGRYWCHIQENILTSYF